ncbi:hypothetical protein LTR10_013141 [Elasticomyces elasticus]|uniref:Ketoreductase domain-containing protein n=1 Tax=Exophiala sideris TaxID=1016849 RepID=A0ABR0JAY6_9EURO|nr:hypothetical protein LTR10_013141 [Elasticomyces elasticus]KAK5030516.1 hypothetical protein LTS07_005300 [Exophiala sideris]KAK5038570.1 hypothetical protein LTR13_004317 [Exophiala sideris]KAK5060451.1 hypothetical protein LTR69_005768 [Exophiala sideris]KAK5183363.1 hypothetical protein LTR44_004364 [Eurotiomycetes sp. CCFEE 6388]
MAGVDVHLTDFQNIFNLEGKVAVVTGGSRGFGLQVASGLLQAGCSKIYITSRDAQACEEALNALNALPCRRPGAKAIAVPADCSMVSELDRLAAKVAETTDHIDILFANAGATWGAPFEKTAPDTFSKVMDLNVKSVFYTVQKLEPLLKKNATNGDPSRVIVTASITGMGLGTLGQNATYAYSASKAAAIHLAKNLAVDLGPRGIITNAICPGFFPTKMASGLVDLQGGFEALRQETPNRRVGQPEDIAGLVVFLSSRASRHLNGAAIAIDGGYILNKGKL